MLRFLSSASHVSRVIAPYTSTFEPSGIPKIEYEEGGGPRPRHVADAGMNGVSGPLAELSGTAGSGAGTSRSSAEAAPADVDGVLFDDGFEHANSRAAAKMCAGRTTRQS